MRWGESPSLCAQLAVDVIDPENLGEGIIVDLGCGYGRDLALLSSIYQSRKTFGVDGAASAAPLWEELRRHRSILADKNSEIKICDLFALDSEFGFKTQISLAFSNFLFHLLGAGESVYLLKQVSSLLADGGYFVGSFVSTGDPTFGRFPAVNADCQQMEDGIWRYFRVDDIKELFVCSNLDLVHLEHRKEIEMKRGHPDEVCFFFAIGQVRSGHKNV